MIRLVVLLLVLCAIAFGVAFLADDPGALKLELFGHIIETTGFVALAVLFAVAVASVIVFMVLRWLWLTPARTTQMMQRRRNRKGFDVISKGILAIGAGDLRNAERQALEAERLAPKEPLTLLLRAQASQMAGDRAGAEKAFRAMLDGADTKVLGLRGLYVEAQRRQDVVALKAIAEEAVKAAPSASWAANALLEHHAMSGNWAEARKAVERNATAGLLTRAQAERNRAVLMTAEALALEETNADQARVMAVDANRLAPDLVPAAALAGRLLGARGDLRKASRLLEAAWEAAPHPDLASVYAQLRHGDSMTDRYHRVKMLVSRTPGDPEGQLALARAALDAGAWDDARTLLAPLVAGAATQRTCLLMAELAAKKDNDQARAREWMAKALRAPRDPVWTADGYSSDHWLPASPITGKLDAFEWKVPLEQIGGPSLHVDDVLADVSEPVVAAAPVIAAGADADPAPALLPWQKPKPETVAESTSEPYLAQHAPDDPGVREAEAAPARRSFLKGFSRF